MNATEHEMQITEEPCIKISKNGEEDPSISFAINIKNTGRSSWKGIGVNAVLLASDGTPLTEIKESVGAEVGAGEVYAARSGFYWIDRQLLAGRDNNFTVIANVSANTTKHAATVEMGIPDKAYSANVMPSNSIDEAGCIESCAVWISEPDDDKEVTIEVGIAYANTSNVNISELKARALLFSKSGNDIDEFDGSVEVNSGAVGLLKLSTMCKASKIKKGKIVIEISESRVQSARNFIITNNVTTNLENKDKAWGFPG